MSARADLATRLLSACRERGLTVATAESCTGGMVAAAITDIAGSSEIFDRGFVTYSNAAKIEMLDVATATLDAHGAVSSETAREMAAGALARSNADLAVSLTGIAGPGGATPGKPVGLVWFGLARRDGEAETFEIRFADEGRASIRQAATQHALQLLLSAAENGQLALRSADSTSE